MRPRQTILLGLLLLVPVLAFLFLYGFGRNRYALPTYLPERADSVRAAGGGWRRDTAFHQVHLPRLIGPAEHDVQELPGLANSLYVVQVLSETPSAQAVGPLTNTPAGRDAQATQVMAQVQEHFRREPRVKLATLVPYADRKALPGALVQDLSERYGTINGKWIVLAAHPAELAQAARYELGLTTLAPGKLPFRPDTEPGNLPAGRLLLLDRDHHVRGYYDATDHYEVDRLLTELNVLLYIYDHGH